MTYRSRISRRGFLLANATGLMVAKQSLAQAPADVPARTDLASVKALVFDTFGTVVDWRTSVTNQVADIVQRKGLKVDAVKFADAWRAGYAPAMDRVRTGKLPWTKLDGLHRLMLNQLLIDFGLVGKFTESELAELNRAWHRLKPWPDSVSGLTRLKKKFIIAPLSNGNISLMTELAKYAGLPWDCILGAELARHYKPDREVYEGAAYFLDLQPRDILMVAAHLGDLAAAGNVGLRTAFVARPLEFGATGESPAGKADLRPTASVNLSCQDFNELASRLGA
jgi:2-haloacid dehalogenase